MASPAWVPHSQAFHQLQLVPNKLANNSYFVARSILVLRLLEASGHHYIEAWALASDLECLRLEALVSTVGILRHLGNHLEVGIGQVLLQLVAFLLVVHRLDYTVEHLRQEPRISIDQILLRQMDLTVP